MARGQDRRAGILTWPAPLRHLPSLLLLAVVLGGAPAFAANDPGDASRGRARTVGVLTRNQYLGGDLGLLAGATSPAAFNTALVALLRQIAATDFPARAERQAAEIAERRPDLVGLQEVWRLECRDLGQPAPAGQGCSSPLIAGAFVDHLEVTLKALAIKKAKYRASATVEQLDTALITFELPGLGSVQGLPFTLDGQRYSVLLARDRDVILARNGVRTRPVRFSGCAAASADGCSYAAQLSVPILRQVFSLRAGFVAVDAMVRGGSYRFVNTHLTPKEPSRVQSRQALELVSALTAGGSTILVGDTNSSPTDQPVSPQLPTPYSVFARAGFVDVWTAAVPGAGPGFTCCQAPDLRNEASALSERVDLILSRPGPAQVEAPQLIGEELADKTPSGLWPSDHAGVSAVLRY